MKSIIFLLIRLGGGYFFGIKENLTVSNTESRSNFGIDLTNSTLELNSMIALLFDTMNSDAFDDMLAVTDSYSIIKYINTMGEQTGHLMLNTDNLDYSKIVDVRISDFNFDGYKDILYLLNDGTIYVLEHNGDTDNVDYIEKTYDLSHLGTPTTFLEVNNNNDLYNDYLFANDQGELYILEGQGGIDENGDFLYSLKTEYLVKTFDSQIRDIQIGDLNNDGLEDIVVVKENNYYEILTNKSNIVTRNEDPTKLGYAFNNFYLFDETKAREDYTDADLFNFNETATNNATIIALYDVIDFSINYVLDENEVNDSSNISTYNIESEDFSLLPATKTNYIFKGWYESSDFSGDPVTVIDNEALKNYTLYAYFELGKLDFNYNLNNGIQNDLNPLDFLIANGATLLDPTRDGYTFDGWFEASDFSGSPITEIAVGTENEVTVYAKWTKVDYDLTFELDGGTATNPSTYDIENGADLVDAEKSGYTFRGYHFESDFSDTPFSNIPVGSFGDKTIYANFEINNYQLNYELNGGTQADNQVTTYTVEDDDYTLLEPTRLGYDFKGWFEDSAFETTGVTIIDTVLVKDFTLYAKWEATTYTITYNLDGGDNDTSNPATYTIESDLIIFVPATKTGYTFTKWANQDASETYVVIIPGSTGNIELYAQFDINTYKVNLLIEGTVSYNALNQEYNVDYSGSLENITDPTLTGYTFKGWTEGNNLLTTAELMQQQITDNVTYVAVFEADPTDPTDPTDPVTPITVTEGTGSDVSYTFTEGTATLNGATYESGAAITTAGDYTLEVTDGDRITTVIFSIEADPTDPTDPTDPVTPITVTEGTGSDVSYTFTEGTGELNGQPYTSGDSISDPGDYTLVITDGSRVSTYTFSIEADIENDSLIINWVSFLIIGTVIGYLLRILISIFDDNRINNINKKKESNKFH